jgi:hypothetical protein
VFLQFQRPAKPNAHINVRLTGKTRGLTAPCEHGTANYELSLTIERTDQTANPVAKTDNASSKTAIAILLQNDWRKL